jgi:TetR/AcrR family transcriptional regulator, mexJK operon transcriptional repressor
MKKAATLAHLRVPQSQPDVEADNRLACLLDTAGEVFMAVGYEAASVGEIAHRLKASKQTIYARYPSKAELFMAAITWRADATYRRLSGLLVSHDPPRKALTAFGTGLLEMVLDASAVAILRLVYMESGRFPELGEVLYDRGAGRCFELMERYIRQQRDLGTLRVDDMGIAAEQFMDMITGKLLMRAALGVAPNPPAKDRKRRVKAAVDVFLAAYGGQAQ